MEQQKGSRNNAAEGTKRGKRKRKSSLSPTNIYDISKPKIPWDSDSIIHQFWISIRLLLDQVLNRRGQKRKRNSINLRKKTGLWCKIRIL